MTLRLGEGWTRREPIGSWPLAGEPRHANSRAFELLYRDLYRYARDEVPGRSYLIAGHRGAGKTSLVTQAVLTVQNQILLESTSSSQSNFSRRPRLQRPLLVKLVGKSLIAPLPSISRGGEQPLSAETAGEDTFESAYAQITIALYRALCAELARGYSVHARSCLDRDRPERMEQAAQLLLDLDVAPDAATLRGYWERIGRLTQGVLWPQWTDTTLRERSIYDQGLREIVAVSTAAQAFRVCSGKIEYTVTRTDNAKQDRRLEGSADIKALLDRLGALIAGGLFAGATLIGGQQTPVEAVGGGVLVWLLSAATLKLTSKRSQERDHHSEYEFIRDHSLQTLDREVPQVIERIRDAGLAPVFVIDELDKIEEPGVVIRKIMNRLKHVSDFGFFCFLTDRNYFDEIESRVAREAYPTEHTYFSERLLIYNRPADLFQYLVGLMEATSLDTEKLAIAVFALAVTYRSKLNFADVAREVSQLVAVNNELLLSADDLRTRGDLRLAATVQLAIEEVLRAEPTATRFRSDPAFAQLAIDALYFISRCWERNEEEPIDLCPETLRADLIARMKGRRTGVVLHPGVAPVQNGAAHSNANGQPTPPPKMSVPQTEATSTTEGEPQDEAEPLDGTDALAWAEPKEDLLDDDLMNLGPLNEPAADKADHAAPVAEPWISPPDMRALYALAVQLANYLVDFDALAAAVRSRPDAVQWPFYDIILREADTQGLIEPIDDTKQGAFRYRFLLDERARPIARVEARWIGSKEFQEIADGEALIAAFEPLLTKVGLTSDNLVEAGPLPATVNQALFPEARTRFTTARKQRLHSDALQQAILTARALSNALNEHRSGLGLAMVLTTLLARDLSGITPQQALRAVARHVAFGSLGQSSGIPKVIGLDVPVTQIVAHLGPSAAQLAAFAAALVELRDAGLGLVPEPTGSTADAVWNAWSEKAAALFHATTTAPRTLHYLDLVTAARGTAPGAIFRSNLSAMTIRDWSRLVLASLPPDEPTEAELAPVWGLFAGLRGLGFSAPVLFELERRGTHWDYSRPWATEATDSLIQPFVDGAAKRPPGLLLIADDRDAAPHTADTPVSRPILSVSNEERSRYAKALEWLAEADAFEGVVYARNA